MLVTVGSGFDAREGLLLLNERTRQVLLNQRITVMKVRKVTCSHSAGGSMFFLVFHVHDKLNKL